MIYMGVAQENERGRSCRSLIANLFTERDDAGPGVKDQPLLADDDFDARSIASDYLGRHTRSGVASPHAPKTNLECGCRPHPFAIAFTHSSPLFHAQNIIRHHGSVNALEMQLFQRRSIEKRFQFAHRLSVGQDLTALSLRA